jgi:hypothetical protein
VSGRGGGTGGRGSPVRGGSGGGRSGGGGGRSEARLAAWLPQATYVDTEGLMVWRKVREGGDSAGYGVYRQG